MGLPKPYEIRSHYHAGQTPATQQNGRLEQQGDKKLGTNQLYNGNPPPHTAPTTSPRQPDGIPQQFDWNNTPPREQLRHHTFSTMGTQKVKKKVGRLAI